MAGDERDPDEGWAFGSFHLTADRVLLGGAGARIDLAAKPLAMLLYLVRNPDRIVPREELHDAIWPDVVVSEAAFDSVLRDLRRALGDSAARGTYVATLRSRGLRFQATVRPLAAKASTGTWTEAAAHLERAIEALDLLALGSARHLADEHRERADLLVALAQARWAGGETSEARRAFLDAAEVGRRASDGEILARAALGFAGRTDVTPGVNEEAVHLLEEALGALPEEDSALRAEVLARLGTESYYANDSRRPDELTSSAVAMAERVGAPGVHAYALTARHFVKQHPEIAPAERMLIGDRVFELVSSGPPNEVLALALQQRVVDLLEAGEGARFGQALDRFVDVERTLQQPFFRWIGALLSGTRLLLSGDVGAAEAAARATLELGEAIGSPNAFPAFAGQLFGIRREQGRLAELLPTMNEIARDGESLPIFRVGRAAVLAECDAGAEAQLALDEVMTSDLSDFPKDQNWLATLGTLGPAIAAHGRESQRRRLFELLSPYSDRIIVVGQGATVHGAVSYHLGLLAASLGDLPAAERHLDDAAERHERLAAPLWLERTQQARATWLRPH